MIKTQMTDLLGIEHPIVGGAMAYLSSSKLVAAVSEAGGLGVLASANCPNRDAFRDELRRIRGTTDKPFAVNLNLFPMMRPIDNKDYLDVLLSEGVKIIETSGHELPEDLTSAIKAAGLKWIHKCVHPRHAQKAERMGADIVTVVGYENGGATGKWDIGTLVLIPTVVQAVKIPVIAGGGVVDGRGLAAVLCLGAQAAIMGSRFVLAEECAIHENVRKALCEASTFDTTLVMRSIGATHRVWTNEAASKVIEIEKNPEVQLPDLLNYIVGEKSRQVYFQGDVHAGMCYISQAVGLIKEVLPAKDIVERTVLEAEKILSHLAGPDTITS